MRLGLSLAILLAWSGAAASEDLLEKQIREELERELDALVKLPPPSLELFFDGLDSNRYELVEASFALDGAPLKFEPGQPDRALHFGMLAPGQHTMTTQLVYREKPSGIVFGYANLKYKLPGRYTFQAQRGLHLRMRIKVEANDEADVKKRLQLLASLEADMLVDVTEEPSGDVPAEGTPPGLPPRAAEPAVARGSPDASTPAPARVERPKRKRIRRHLKKLLQNLARSTREEASEVSDTGEWTEVGTAEEVPAEKPAPVPSTSPAPASPPATGAPPAAAGASPAAATSTAPSASSGAEPASAGKRKRGTKRRTGGKSAKTRAEPSTSR